MQQITPLYQWSNGVIMIAIFGFVCLLLIGFLIKFMTSNDRKKDNNQTF